MRLKDLRRVKAYCLFALFLLISVPFQVLAQEEDKVKDKGLLVNIDLAKSAALEANVLGLSLDHFLLPIQEKDTLLLRYFDKLEPAIMRFPSSHLANYLLPGEALNLTILEAIKDSVIRSELIQYEESYKSCKNPFETAFEFMSARNIKLQLVANLFTGDTNEFKAILEFVKSSGVELSGVEMGYGLYHKNYRSQFKKPEVYIQRANAFKKILDKNFNQVPVGLCISPLKKFNLNVKSDPENSKWNTKVSNVDFADAWALQLHFDLGKCSKKSGIERQFACALERLIDYQLKDLPEYFLELKKQFSKKIWLSSFGLSLGSGKIQNSFLEANIVYDFGRACIEQNLRDSFLIERFFYNKTWHPINYEGLFSRKALLEKEVDNRAKVYERAAFYPLFFLKNIMNKDVEKLIGTGASNIPALIKTGKVSFSGFYEEQKLTAYFYLMNKSDIPIKLDAIYFKGKLRFRGSTGRVETYSLSSGDWYSSIGLNSWVKEADIYDNSELFMVYDRDKIQPRDFVILPKSIYYIKVKMK